MLGRPRRTTVLVAVLALLVAAPMLECRACDVCPADCPMHAARRAASAHIGCHEGGMPHARASAGPGACGMRAACGHHGGATVVVFHGLAPVGFSSAPALVMRSLLAERPEPAPGPRPDPPIQPPELPSV